MGIKITPAGKAVPGLNGVPGWVFPNKLLFQKLHPWTSFGSRFVPRAKARIEKELELFERTTGIKERGLLIDEKLKLPYPTERLGIHACQDGLSNVNKLRKESGQSELKFSDIDGFIFVSNTQDRVFTPGKEICKVLGIKPQFYSFVGGLSCSGFVKALREAAVLFERKKDVNTVAIVVSELTSKLRQKDGDNLQSFLFGDAAVMFLIERSDKGGIQLWGPNIDLESPDVLHFLNYSGEDKEIQEMHKRLSSGNDPRLKEFAFYEVNKMPDIFKLFMKHSISKAANTQAVILPQVAKKPSAKTYNHFKEIAGQDLNITLVSSSLPFHANTGAAATPLAWHEGAKNNEISSDRIVTNFNFGFSGTHAITTYDPSSDKTLIYYGEENDPPELTVEISSDMETKKDTSLHLTNGDDTIIEERKKLLEEAERLREQMKIS